MNQTSASSPVVWVQPKWTMWRCYKSVNGLLSLLPFSPEYSTLQHMFLVLSLADSRAPNLGRSTCTMISGCYSPANPSKWTQGSLTSWNLSPRCQETPNIPPVCDPGLTRWPSPALTQPLLCFLKEEGGKQTDCWRMMDVRLDETWWDLMRRATCKRDRRTFNTV